MALTPAALKSAMVAQTLAIPGIVIDNMAELEASKEADATAIINTITSLGLVIIPAAAIATAGTAAAQSGPPLPVPLNIT